MKRLVIQFKDRLLFDLFNKGIKDDMDKETREVKAFKPEIRGETENQLTITLNGTLEYITNEE